MQAVFGDNGGHECSPLRDALLEATWRPGIEVREMMIQISQLARGFADGRRERGL
jgi:hypothetical protein